MLTVLSLQWLTYSKHIILSALITVVLMCIGRCTPLQIKRQIHYIFYHQFFLTYIQFLIKLLSSQLFGQPPPRCSLLQVTPIYNIHVFYIQANPTLWRMPWTVTHWQTPPHMIICDVDKYCYFFISKLLWFYVQSYWTKTGRWSFYEGKNSWMISVHMHLYLPTFISTTCCIMAVGYIILELA